jgi:hypothetical protein
VKSIENEEQFASSFLEISAISGQRLFIDGFVFLASQSGVNIGRSPAIRDITGHIAEGAGLFAGGTSIRHCLGFKGVTTI